MARSISRFRRFIPLIVDTAFGDNVTMELLVMNDRLDAMQKCLTDLSFWPPEFSVCGEGILAICKCSDTNVKISENKGFSSFSEYIYVVNYFVSSKYIGEGRI